jgi:hypothetical protein
VQDQDYCCGDVMLCQADGYGYLRRLFEHLAPQCTPLPDLLGLATQIDNLIAGYRIRLGEMPDPANQQTNRGFTS